MKWVHRITSHTSLIQFLGDYFSGEKALTRVKKNATLMNWFKGIAKQIESLDYTDFVLAGRKIAQLITALEQVEEFHQAQQFTL